MYQADDALIKAIRDGISDKFVLENENGNYSITIEDITAKNDKSISMVEHNRRILESRAINGIDPLEYKK